MADRAETLEFPVTAPGADQAAREMDAVGKSIGRSSTEWKKMSAQGKDAAGALNAVGNALGPIIPGFGELQSTVSNATNAFKSLTTVVGGPWAAAVAGAVVSIGIIAKKYADAAAEAERLTQAHKEAAEAFRELPIGGASAAGGAAWMEATLDEQERMMAARNKRALESMALAEEAAAAEGKIRERGGRGGARGPSFDATISELASGPEMDVYSLNEDERQRLWEAEQMRMAEREQATREHQAQLANIERERIAEMMRVEEEAAAQRRRLSEEQRALFMGSARDMVNINVRMLSDLAKGNKVSAKQIVQSIGDSLVARGTEAIWQGSIMSANPLTPGLGAPLIAVGGAAVVAGLGMGAASRGMSGGGSSGPATAGNATTSPVAPIALGYDRTGGREATGTVNVYMPTVVAPTGEDGERVHRALEEAKRRGLIN